MRRVLAVSMLVLVCAAGCNCASKPDGPLPLDGGRAVDLSKFDYAQVATAMNERAGRLERFWAATLTRVWYIGKEGENEVEQLDGDLHIVQPDKIALSLQKLGIDGAALGANERFYWYMDLMADDPIAFIGTHEKADPDRLAHLGVPVHPLDLLILLGFSRVPDEPMNPQQPLNLSPNGGHIVLTAPARWGIVEYSLDPETLEPVRVTIRRAPKLPPVLTADMKGTVLFNDRINLDLDAVRSPARVF